MNKKNDFWSGNIKVDKRKKAQSTFFDIIE